MPESNKKRRASNEQTARARAAQMRLEQQRKERTRRALLIGVSTIAVLAVVAVVIILGRGSGGNQPVAGLGSPLATTVAADISSVPPATLAGAGAGTGLLSQFGLPQTTTGDSPLTQNGKPEVLYIGAEFCPYCAAERWSLAIALSRFGTLSGLKSMRSGTTDGDYWTLSFRGSSYKSKYLSFRSLENEDRDHNPISGQQPTSAEAAVWNKYTDSNGPGRPGFPFIDFGGKTVIPGPTFDPALLGTMTQQQIATAAKSGSGNLGKAIDATANQMTAAICQLTDDKPTSVCTPSITALTDKLAAAKVYPTGATTSPSS